MYIIIGTKAKTNNDLFQWLNIETGNTTNFYELSCNKEK